MVLYIEYVIIDNFLIDFFLIKLLSITFKEKYSRIRVFLSCVVGIIGALLLPYIVSMRVLSILYRLIIALLMIALLKKYSTIKSFVKHIFCFICYTALLGGAIVGVLNALNIKYTISGVLCYNLELPMGVFLLILLLGIFLIKKLIICVSLSIKESSYMCNLRLVDRDTSIEIRGYLDSGNLVNVDGEGISIISMDTFLKLYEDIGLMKLLYGRVTDSGLKNIRYINIDGLSKGKEHLTFTIDKLCIDGREYENQRVAVAHKNFGEFDCILSSNYLGVMK